MFLSRRTSERITVASTFEQILTAFALAHAVNFALLTLSAMALLALPQWVALVAVALAGVAFVTAAGVALRLRFAQYRNGQLRITQDIALATFRDCVRLCAGVALCVAFVAGIAQGWFPHSARVCGAQVCFAARKPWAVGMLRIAQWAVLLTALVTWRAWLGIVWALWMELTMPQYRESLLVRSGITPDGVPNPPFAMLRSPQRGANETVVVTEAAEPTPPVNWNQGGGDE